MEQVRSVVDDMVETCATIGGIGLAAPQVGIPLRFFVVDGQVIDESPGYRVVINPALEAEGCTGEGVSSEGCLSLPGLKFDVRRFTQLTVTFTELDGQQTTLTLTGDAARVFQHEMDHLAGKLIVDTLSPWRKTRARRKMEMISRRMRQQGLSYLDVVRSPLDGEE
jgi:peptide deformylase